MKNKDLSNAIGNINLKYVEEAENFTAKRMSLTKIVSLAACIAILVTAIPAALILNREDGKTDAPVVTTPLNGEDLTPNQGSDGNTDKEKLTVIFCDAETLALEKDVRENILKDKSVDFRVFDVYSESLNECQYLDYTEDIPQKLIISAGTEDITCTLDYAYYTKDILSKDEAIRARAKIARYKVDKECFPDYFRESDAWVLYRVDTKEIVEMSIPSSSSLNYGPMTQAEVRAMADRDMRTLFGEDILSKYTCEMEYTSNKYIINIVYRRSIVGFSTKEEIRLHYDGHGKLLTVLTRNLGLFDKVESIVTEKSLLKAESEALLIIDDKLVDDKFLIMSKDGEPCIFYYCKSLVDGEMKYYKIGYKIQ